MNLNQSSRKVRLALESLEQRTNPSASFFPFSPDDLVGDPAPGSLPGKELPDHMPGLFHHLENSFFDAVDDHQGGDDSSHLRIGNRFQTLPTQEIASLLNIPTDQPVWIVSETLPAGDDSPDDSEDFHHSSRLLSRFSDDDDTQDPPGSDDDSQDSPDDSHSGLDDWESLESLLPFLGSLQVTVSLSSFNFAGDSTNPDGQMFLFTTPDSVWFNTSDGVSPDQDTLVLDATSLQNLSNINWLFTQAGSYDLALNVSINFTVGDVPQSFSQDLDLQVLVGEVEKPPVLVGSVGGGADAMVTLIDPATKQVVDSFQAYQGYKGGVVTAIGDVTGDGVEDFITAPGSREVSHITIRDGSTHDVLTSVYAFPGFVGNYVLASGDVDGDGFSEVLVGVAQDGPPHLVVFSGAALAQNKLEVLDSLYVYDERFQGGIRLTCGDLDNDGMDEVIVGSGEGATPNIITWKFNSTSGHLEVQSSYLAYDAAFKGGIYVECSDVNGDGFDDVITGSGQGADPTVVVFDGKSNHVISAFYPYLNYPENSAVTTKGIDVSIISDPSTGTKSLVVAPVSGRGSKLDSPADLQEFYRNHPRHSQDDSVWTETPPAWFNGSGVVQINLDSGEIEYEYDFFPGYQGDINIAAS